MNAPSRQPFRVELALRSALKGAGRRDIMDALDWDDSQVSRFLSGGQGVPLGKIDKLFSAIGYVVVTRRYLDAMCTMGEVGMHCECARQGVGECGGKAR